MAASEQTVPETKHTKILFDQSHAELWGVKEDTLEEDQRFWSDLRAELEEEGYQVDTDDTFFVSGSLTESNYDILVLAAPRLGLQDEEVREISAFVESGKGLLIVNDWNVLVAVGTESTVERWGGNPRNLTQEFGFCFQEYLASQPETISDFSLHYIWTSVKQLRVNGLCRIDVEVPEQGLAFIPRFEEPFVAVSYPGEGRVLGIGDGNLFENGLIDEADNKQFASNIFRWLARKNPLDLVEIQLTPDKVTLGSSLTIDLVLENVGSETIESVDCEIHISQKPYLNEAMINLPYLPGGERRTVQWHITPRKPGLHQASLFLKVSGTETREELRFHKLCSFSCQIPAQLDLVLKDEQGQPMRHGVTGQPFLAEAIVNWAGEIQENALTLELNPGPGLASLSDRPGRVVEDTTERYTWTLQGDTAGHHSIDFKVTETGQGAWANIWVKSSTEQLIQNIYNEYIVPLDAEMVRHLSQMHPSFASETIRHIPFRILPLEEFIEFLYPSDIVERVREIIRYIRLEDRQEWLLLNLLLAYVAPSFSAGVKDGQLIGACVPFAPELTRKLMALYPGIREELLFNFLLSSDSKPADIKMTLASALAHEKYGHGFFYSFTTLGQQLATLDQHGLLNNVRPEELAAPYPLMLFEEYGEVIRMVADSAIVVNEGFAAWLELALLQKMDSEVRLAIHQRQEFIERADKLERLQEIEGGYFNLFPSPTGSQYKAGCLLLNEIARRHGPDGGERRAVEVVLKAADVDFGIGEAEGRIAFSLTASQIRQSILTNEEVRSDERLYKITRKLRYKQKDARSG